LASVIHVVPAGVVNAMSSPRSVVTEPRNALWYWAASIGGPASIHLIASAIGTPAAGAGVDEVADVADVVADDDVPVRDGVIGVSWVCFAWPPVAPEHPATSSDAVSNTAIRITTG
jgi:hypothetical protein